MLEICNIARHLLHNLRYFASHEVYAPALRAAIALVDYPCLPQLLVIYLVSDLSY